MRKWLIALMIIVPLTSFALESSFVLGNDINHNTDFDFKPHHGEGQFDSYLSMTVNYEPIKNLQQQLSKQYPRKLQSRGEAHITVITPPEYWDSLRHKMTMHDIDLIARALRIQAAEFTVLCLGKAKAKLGKHVEEAFYVVVESTVLLSIRKNVHALYIEKGGDPADFNPFAFYPHITVGFTERDLYIGDGAIKNVESCYADLVAAG
ncbi:MAG: 2'-5' RNA ligase [Phenylobacterium sp.]|jgi:2'-5' RNA ligase